MGRSQGACGHHQLQGETHPGTNVGECLSAFSDHETLPLQQRARARAVTSQPPHAPLRRLFARLGHRRGDVRVLELDGTTVGLVASHPMGARLMDSQTSRARRAPRARLSSCTHVSDARPTHAGVGGCTARHGYRSDARIESQSCAATSGSLLLHGGALYRSQTRAVFGERERVSGGKCGAWVCQRKKGGSLDDRVGGIRWFFDRVCVWLTVLGGSSTRNRTSCLKSIVRQQARED